MQQSVSPTIRQNTHKREREVKVTDRNIRAKSTGASQVHTDNSFLKEEFADIYLFDTEGTINTTFKDIINPQKNIEKLVKAASNYLSQYGAELSFSPSGKFGQDITRLVKAVTRLLPENQKLNIDYISNEFVFIVYQSHPKRYWDTITYIPISIAHTMRPTIRKLFLRFIAFIMQQNNLPTIKNTYFYEFIVEDIKNNMQENSEDIEQQYIDAMRSYDNKTGKASKLLNLIERLPCTHPNTLLSDLKSLKRLSVIETEQVACMVRGVELMSQNLLGDYTYNNTYDDFYNESEYDGEIIDWKDLICVSWSIGENDPLVQYHFQMQNEQCQNSYFTEPMSFIILSETKKEKLPSSDFPFEWLDYLCDDYFKYLVQDENE